MVALDDADVKVAVVRRQQRVPQPASAARRPRLIVTPASTTNSSGPGRADAGLKVDGAVKAGTDIGPVVDQSQLDQDLKYISIGKDEAPARFGGERLNREAPGFYLQPALVHRCEQQDADRAGGDLRAGGARSSGSRIVPKRWRPRTTPISVCHPASAHQLEIRQRLQRNSEAGMVMVNLPIAGVDYHVPFGGRKGLQLRRPRAGAATPPNSIRR